MNLCLLKPILGKIQENKTKDSSSFFSIEFQGYSVALRPPT